ncbi:hypothetical protein ACW2QC_06370 [Virgibacillus sp. FSP13]
MRSIFEYEDHCIENGSTSSITISRWISTNAIFTAPSIVITHGIMEGILFGFTAFLATVIMYFVFKRSVMKQSKGNALKGGNLELGKLRVYYLVSSYMQLYLMVLGGGLVVSIMCHFTVIMGMVIFIVLCLLYSLVKFEPNFKHHIKLALLFVVTTGVLVYMLVTENVEQIYQGIRLYHPYLLFVNWKSVILFGMAVCIIFIGKLIGDPISLKNFNDLVRNKKGKYWLLIGFVWGAIPLSFVSIIISVIYSGGFESIFTIFQDLFSYFGNSVFTSIIPIILILILIDTSSMEIKVLRKHAMKNNWSIFLTLMVLMICTIFFNDNWLSFSFVFFMTGIWIVAYLPVIGAIILNKLHDSKRCEFLGIVSAISGYISLYWFDPVIAILVTFLISGCLSLLEFCRKGMGEG